MAAACHSADPLSAPAVRPPGDYIPGSGNARKGRSGINRPARPRASQRSSPA